MDSCRVRIAFDLASLEIDPYTPTGPIERPNFALAFSRPTIESHVYNVSHDDSL
jgi:hypothetical protein